MTFFNTRSEGLLILPTHRLVANLASFDIELFPPKNISVFEQEDYAFGSEAARAAAYERFHRDLLASGKTEGLWGCMPAALLPAASAAAMRTWRN